MNGLTRFFMQRPVLFWSLVGLIMVVGTISFIVMPKLEDPAITPKQAIVIVPYPGADAHKVELEVAQMVEDELRALPNVKRIETECQNDAAMFTVVFKMTVLNKDLEQHFDLLRRKVNDLSGRLPGGCYDPIVVDDLMDVYGIFYALTGDGYSYHELYEWARLVRRELLDVDGVKKANIAGKRDEVISITLTKGQVAQNGLLPAKIMMALQSAGKTVNAGKYASGDQRISFAIGSEASDVESIRDIMIPTVDGASVRLGDIANVERGYAEPQRNGFFVNGKPALAICLAMEADAIVPDVGRDVESKLEQVLASAPAGIRVEKMFFQPEKVSDAISSFMLNLLESVAIVILVLIFTMGFRSGLIIGFGLLLTVAASFPILLMCGTTLHRISLGAFIIAMGMLVDNAVVIMDGILVDKKRGLGRDVYLHRIGKNTAMPLLGATVIAASTFLGVYLSPDTAGEYAKDLFLVLCVSLLASWVFALIQVPICSDKWLPVQKAREGGSAEVYNSPVHQWLRKAIAFMIGYKKTTIAVSIVILAASIVGLTRVKNLCFPDFDYSQFIVECTYPAQTSPDKIQEELAAMTSLLLENPEIERVAASMGSAPARYCLVRPMTNGGDTYGELMVDCRDYKTVVKQIPRVRDELREKFPDAYIRIRKYNFSINSSHTVEVEFTGPDPAVLKQLSGQAEAIMRQCPYVDPYSVENNWKAGGKKMVVEHRQHGRFADIGRSDIGNSLLAATDGMPVGVVYGPQQMTLVNLHVRNEDGSRIGNLKEIPVWSMMNVHVPDVDYKAFMAGSADVEQIKSDMFKSVPLGSLSPEITWEQEEPVVRRVNGERAIEAECDPLADDPKATPSLVRANIKEQIEAIPLPEGYAMRWIGDSDIQNEAVGNVMRYQPIALAIMLVILLFLFNSWKKVLLIFMCFPFVLCGITPTLLLTGMPFTFMALIGTVGLIGMIIKNAIVLMDEVNRLQAEENATPYHSVIEATVSRVRPVIMASLTTIVGMIPLITDPMYSSMAITIMSGLTVGTVITLLLLPVFYTVFFRIKKPIETTN